MSKQTYLDLIDQALDELQSLRADIEDGLVPRIRDSWNGHPRSPSFEAGSNPRRPDNDLADELRGDIDYADPVGRVVASPRLLDLFCGAGGAGMGYHLAGFEVVGVDIEPQPDYPFEFWQADAMQVLTSWDVGGTFDAIHASPPCQGETALRVLWQDREYERLLVPTLEALGALTIPWVVENVDNAEAPASAYKVRLCGSSFGLRVRRHRWFWSNVALLVPPCNHAAQKGQLVGVYGNSDGHVQTEKGYKRGPRQVTTVEAREVMEMPWATKRRGLTNAIPPAYTEYLGRQLIDHVETRHAA